jgi:hypothetical protein
MAKSALRLRAREMRNEGESIIVIAKEIGVAKSTVSLWCRDIELTAVQINRLLKNKELGIRIGQLKGAKMQKMRRAEKIRTALQNGLDRFATLHENEHFSSGIALYLAEGAKKSRQVHFVNSDPRLIKFMLGWFERFFQIPLNGISFRLMINEIHKHRENRVLEFWSSYLGVPAAQFRRTTFVHSKQAKIYQNHNRYFGTMHFTVLKSSHLLYIISGLIEGLLQHVPMPA